MLCAVLYCQVTQGQIVSSFPKGRNSESELTGEGNGEKAMLVADSRPSPEEHMLEARTRSATPQADERSPTPQFIPTSSSASGYSQIHTRAGGRSASLESLQVMGSNFGRPDGSGPLQGLSGHDAQLESRAMRIILKPCLSINFAII